MQLEVENAQGSLRFGGEIDRLRISNQRFTLQIKNLTLAWNLGQLLQRRLAVERLHAARVDYRAQPEAPPDDTSSQPLRSLQLPLAIDLPVQIDTFTWADGPNAQLEHLAATYRYDRDQHRLQLSSLRYGPQQAQLSASVQLGGQAPLQLTAQAQASATPALELAQPLALQAQVDISGQLFGPQAQLQVTAQVQPQATDTDAPTTGANSALPPLSARLHATVTPWQAQPLPQAQLELQHVNLALFAPQLPPSDLTGQLHITTDADGVWRFRTDLTNPQAGPWDAPALPLQQLQAQAQFDGQVWTLDQLQLQLPHGPKVPKGPNNTKKTPGTAPADPGTPGGQLHAQGQWTVATQALNAQVQLQGINPAHVLTSLPSQRISGSVSAETLAPADPPTDTTDTAAASPADPAIDFRVAIADPQAPPTSLAHARAQGRWAAGVLTLQEVAIRAWGAELSSPSLSWDSLQHQASSPQTTRLQVPGLAAELTGTLTEHTGQGQLRTQLRDAAATVQWLGRLPGVGDLTRLTDLTAPLAGQAQLDLAWQGGWGRLRPTSPPAEAEAQTDKTDKTDKTEALPALSIKLLAKIPNISYKLPAQEATKIQDLTLAVQGPLEKLTAHLQGQLHQGSQQAHIDTQWQAQWHTPSRWQLQAQTLTLLARPSAKSGDWRLALEAPVTIVQTGPDIQASAGALQLTPPRHQKPNRAGPGALGHPGTEHHHLGRGEHGRTQRPAPGLGQPLHPGRPHFGARRHQWRPALARPLGHRHPQRPAQAARHLGAGRWRHAHCRQY